ncbi:MAG: carboxypeptidase regulatory-like domain-containing protein [Candidatus Cloacimonadaceae bacterium]|nr:carboxypeptidase regulatory-like domain-containing protein [Candidatus Cloacimonadaceae bacterium]
MRPLLKKLLICIALANAVIGVCAESRPANRLPEPFANDLSADQVWGQYTPGTYSQSIYTVRITNRGYLPQSRYSVVLLGSPNIELASVPGIEILPGRSLEFTLPYTHLNTNIGALRAQVINSGDENPADNYSPYFQINVRGHNAVYQSVGIGSTYQQWPFNVYQRTSLFQTIYYQDEIGMAGTISGLSFTNIFGQHVLNKPTQVWLGVTNKGDLSEAMIPTTMFTQVFSGNVNYPDGINTVSITFQVPFVYEGGNLVLTVYRPMDNQIYNINNNFKGTYLQSSRSRNTSGNSFINPADPPTYTVPSNFVPATTFTFAPLQIPLNTRIFPLAKKFGVREPGSVSHQTLKLMNAGNDVSEISGIELIGNASFNLQHCDDLPLLLSPGRYHEFSVCYAPIDPGEHKAVLRIQRAGLGLVHLIELSGYCEPPALSKLPHKEDFDRDASPRLPSSWNTLNLSSASPARVSSHSVSFRSAPNSAYMFNAGDGGAPLYLISPRLPLETQGGQMRIKFSARADYPVTLELGSMLSPSEASSFTPQQVFSLNARWNVFCADIPLLGEYIAFKHGGVVSSVSIFIDDVWLERVPVHDLSAMRISGNRSPSVDAATRYHVEVQNWGSVTESDYFIELYAGEDDLIGRQSGLPLAAGAISNFAFDWVPQNLGEQRLWARTLLRMDENPLNDRSYDYLLQCQPPGELHLLVGEADQLSRIPMDVSVNNSLYETIIKHEELYFAYGHITGITLYTDFVADLSPRPLKLWVGTTALADLADGWIPASDLELVFDGSISFPLGRQSIYIPFLQALDYRAGQNLVLMIHRPWEIFTYSMWNTYICREGGQNRARSYASSAYTIDPMMPNEGLLSGVIPLITIHLQTGGLGDLGGRIFDQHQNPVEGARIRLVQFGIEALTDNSGYYRFEHVISGECSLEIDRFGYQPQQIQVLIPDGGLLVLDAYLIAYPRIGITGRVIGSDTGAGIANALIELGGYQSLSVLTDGSGYFAFADVCGEVLYSHRITADDYSPLEGMWQPGTQHFDAGTIVLNEITHPANYVRAELDDAGNVSITWRAPDSFAGEIVEGFEEPGFPPSDWAQTILNAGAANAQGVYPTWCRIPGVTLGGSTAQPSEGQYQAGLWWSYQHQDEWLISPLINCPPEALLGFDTYAYYGSVIGDHYYVKISVDNGNSWTVLWDASALSGGWNMYDTPVSISLAQYAGLQIRLAWHAEDSIDDAGLWYVWFIDNIYLGNASGRMWLTIDKFERGNALDRNVKGRSEAPIPGFSRSGRDNPILKSSLSEVQARAQLGYRVYRLSEGQEQAPGSWISLAELDLSQLCYVDQNWNDLPDGRYRWAVRALHTAGVVSVPAFSNVLVKQNINGNLAGIVRSPSSQPLAGATVSAGIHSTLTNNAGAYSMILPVGSYDVTASASGYQSFTHAGVVIYEGLTTTQNFILYPGSEDGEELGLPLRTELHANFPNPFNPSTTISFSLKESQRVSLNIYDIRGRRVKSLMDAVLAAGKHSLIWDGRDNDNRAVGGGIYLLRMQAGTDSYSRKILLLK